MQHSRQAYPTDLTDSQWEAIQALLKGLRVYKWSKREQINAVLYLVKTGCQWQLLPHDFPPHFTVHSFYRRARLSGLWDKILHQFVKISRVNEGRSPDPSYAIIDSQNVKTSSVNREQGIDGGKKKLKVASVLSQ